MHLRSRPSLNVLAAFVAGATIFGASGAVAATVITSKQIKDGTIRNVDVAKGTLTADRLTPGARSSLKGQTGPRGAAGAPGAAGAKGAQGIQGVPGIQGPKGEAGGEQRGTLYEWNVTYDSGPGSAPKHASVMSSQKIPAGSQYRVLELLDVTTAGYDQCTDTTEVEIAGQFLASKQAAPTVTPDRSWRDVGKDGLTLRAYTSCYTINDDPLTGPLSFSARVIVEVRPKPTFDPAQVQPFN